MEEKRTNSVSRSSPVTAAVAPGIDLHLDLDGAGLRAGLLAALRTAVRSGRLAPGTRLPASRTLASDLGIARSTVTECYSELVAEGWLSARQGSGTRVSESVAGARPSEAGPERVAARRVRGGLEPGAQEFADFPRLEWISASRRALAAAAPSAFGYGDPRGRIELRSALSDYLARVRGVVAAPERIVIASGFHHGLTVLARALVARGADRIAVEEYGLGLYRSVLTDAGLAIPPIPVDEHGARTDKLDQVGNGHPPAAVLLTPAHQFPTGVALSAERRVAALDWARRTGGLILEDDYDGEFRYDRRPVGALQGLDPDRTVYFGTASKSLAPALRIGWMVVPEHVLPEVLAAKGRVETVSVLDQLTLAEFIRSGAFDRHVRSRRQSYRRRRDQLVAALQHGATGIRVTGLAAGLQVVVELPPGTESATVRAAAERGIAVTGLAEFRHPHEHSGSAASRPAARATADALVINFSAVSDSAWPGVLAALVSVMPS